MTNSIQETFGNIDIYLFDQLLKGRFNNCKKIVDVGCGGGRNIIYFLKNGFEVYGVDQNPKAIMQVKSMVKELAPETPTENFVIAEISDMPLEKNNFDLAICSAVLHFAYDETHFHNMLKSIWDLLKPGGYFFARLASDIGIEKLVKPLGKGRCHLPDGSERFLVNHKILLDYTKELKGQLFEPLKTTNVQNLRCMTTWCLQKM